MVAQHAAPGTDPACSFCRIVQGTLPAPIVFEEPKVLAFLDHRPLFPGHCLLIPRRHYETVGDLPADAVAPLFTAARLLCLAVEQALQAEGTFLAVNNRVSQSVPHLHVHVVPRRKKDGLRGFFWPRTKYRDETEQESIRGLLHDAIYRLKESGVL
jgi:histidine triad (HIT) family protein